jgi:excisionase family DNA binding protein
VGRAGYRDEKVREQMSPSSKQNLKRTLKNLHQALEELESALVEFEEALEGEASERPQRQGSLELLSIPQVCQELGMGKSWTYRRLKSGEIPSIKLGSAIKVARTDLEEYLHNSRYKPPAENDIN